MVGPSMPLSLSAPPMMGRLYTSPSSIVTVIGPPMLRSNLLWASPTVAPFCFHLKEDAIAKQFFVVLSFFGHNNWLGSTSRYGGAFGLVVGVDPDDVPGAAAIPGAPGGGAFGAFGGAGGAFVGGGSFAVGGGGGGGEA
eukprot:212071-Amphidinium_carterae.2